MVWGQPVRRATGRPYPFRDQCYVWVRTLTRSASKGRQRQLGALAGNAARPVKGSGRARPRTRIASLLALSG